MKSEETVERVLGGYKYLGPRKGYGPWYKKQTGAPMITPTGIEIKVGQRWRENDRRFSRVVEVVGIDTEKQKIQVKYVRTTTASLSRFNGKYGGYSLVTP
jgi:hypothetical protein